MARLMELLAKRDHSRFELRSKLKKALHAPEEIEEALIWAEERRWLLPENELASRAANQLSRKGKSSQQIRHWLKERGLPSAVVSESDDLASAEKTAGRAWPRLLRAARRDLERRGRPAHATVSSAMRLRVVRLLVSRGFSIKTAQSVYARLLKENPLE